jgi:hypothetical protein
MMALALKDQRECHPNHAVALDPIKLLRKCKNPVLMARRRNISLQLLNTDAK